MNEPPLNTVSLRLRVTAAVIIVLSAVLILLGVAVNATFVVQSNRNLDALLAGRVQLARQLARSGVGPQALVNRVDAEGVRAHLVLRNGQEFGTPPGHEHAGFDGNPQATELGPPDDLLQRNSPHPLPDHLFEFVRCCRGRQ